MNSLEKQTCANCIEYKECLLKWENTLLSRSEKIEDCVCSHWKQGENAIQTRLF